MGYPSEYDHPALAIIDRSLANLRHIERVHFRKEDDVFEFTELLNASLGLVVHPWDQLLDQDRLHGMEWSDPQIIRWGFKRYISSKPYVADTEPDRSPNPQSLGEMLRWIRNGFAHGNMELLDFGGAMRRQLNTRIEYPQSNDIVAVEVWNADPRTKVRKWGTVLSTRELNELIQGIKRIAKDRDREYWSERARQIASANEVMKLA